MKTYLITLTILFTAAAVYAQPQERKFNVGAGGKLEMNVNFGDIRIETGKTNEVIVRADDDFEEDDKISQSGNTIKILSEYPKDYRISIPSDFTLSINSTGGDIIISGKLNGDLKVVTAAGLIQFGEVNGNVTANTGGGDIKGAGIRGKVSLNTAGGDISIANTDGELVLNSAGGDIKVDNVTKSATINTGGGNITLGKIEGKGSVRTGGGDIKVASAVNGINITTGGGEIIMSDSKGDVAVSTGGGDVVVNNKSGNIKIKTGAGNVAADITPGAQGENHITTGSGDVRLVIPENSKTTIRVIRKGKHHDDVHINSDFSLTTEDIRENELVSVYQLNGGGSLIEIKTGFGTVELKKKK